jgi:hypothetical protein
VDHDVHLGQFVLMQAERLADDAPDAISSHGAAGSAHANGHAEPRPAAVVGNILDSEECVADATSGLACLLEVPGFTELLGRLET